jgi:CubicO group peptidase (beta-lactamase class C family)
VVSVYRGGEIEFSQAYGLADRAHQIPNTLDTRFAIASGTKGLTALTVVSLISDGALGLSTAARSVLGGDLPLIGEDVTVEHLLAHRSGIGDHVDEEAGYEVTDWTLTVPAQDLDHRAVPGGARRHPRWCVPAATSPPSRGVTALVSGSVRATARCSSRDSTPVSHSGVCTTRGRPSPAPVISNSSNGAWPVAQLLDEPLAG